MTPVGIIVRAVIVLGLLSPVGYDVDKHIQSVHERYSPIPHGSYTVMAIGGSNAEGWGDSTKQGYLKYAFEDLSKDEGKSYTFVNKSKEGLGPVQFEGDVTYLQQDVKPQMFVMAYGILDDIHDKTPFNQFQSDIKSQIRQALTNYEAVVVTTPPATEASYGKNKEIEEEYAWLELQTAKSLHNPHVYTIDLLDQMKTYYHANHVNIETYSKDGWHLNTKGHELAGQMLANDMYNAFSPSTTESVYT